MYTLYPKLTCNRAGICLNALYLFDSAGHCKLWAILQISTSGRAFRTSGLNFTYYFNVTYE